MKTKHMLDQPRRTDRHTMKTPHAIVVPYPVQGHVIPHMELSHHLVERGFKITFVNTEFNHKRIMATLRNNQNESQINLVTISDGLTEEDRNDIGKLTEALICVFPREVEAVIKGMNGSNDSDDITCIISDIGWLLAIVGEKIGIQTATFWTMSAGILALLSNIPKLIETGITNSDGTPVKDQTIQLSSRMPLMRTTHFVWNCIGDLKTQKVSFDATIVYNEAVKSVNWHLCNTSYELEPAAFELIPNVLPIGPLLASSGPRQSLGRFWPEDSTCLNWLNQQPSRSVIYVAFGSFTVFDRIQFQELAMGLEQSNQPFLWVVRPDLTKGYSDVYPDGFQTRVAAQGQMVAWAPQQKVLSHPSVACFISHCGWNSTLESLSNGVPFLCWPYFADQFQNQSQICDVWKVGLGLNKNESGIVPRQEIKEKVNELLANDGIRTRVTELKETIKTSVGQGGSSSTNLDKFVKGIQN